MQSAGCRRPFLCLLGLTTNAELPLPACPSPHGPQGSGSIFSSVHKLPLDSSLCLFLSSVSFFSTSLLLPAPNSPCPGPPSPDPLRWASGLWQAVGALTTLVPGKVGLCPWDAQQSGEGLCCLWRVEGCLPPLFCWGGGSHYLSQPGAPPLWFPICSYLNKKISFSGRSL